MATGLRLIVQALARAAFACPDASDAQSAQAAYQMPPACEA